MASFKEIVTKAVIGKGKKKFTTTNTVIPEIKPDTILGCWVINHNFRGYKENDKITVAGSYDINIWYSCENDSKTEVVRQTNEYKETVLLKAKEDIDSNEEIIVRSLKQPSCVKAEIENGAIIYTIEKELGIELVGDTKVKIAIDEEDDDWEEILDDEEDLVNQEIESSVKEEFLS